MFTNSVRRASGLIIPNYGDMYDATRKSTAQIEVEPGREKTLSFFYSDVIEEKKNKSKDIIVNGERVGIRARHDIVFEDKIDRAVAIYQPTEKYRSDYPFSVIIDTAWFTGLEGHNDRIAEHMMHKLGVSVALIGPEFSASYPEAIGVHMTQREVVNLSQGMTLARSAEASISMYRHIQSTYPEYDLSDNLVDAGESRGAMIAQIRRVYAEKYGLTAIGSDVTDPCVSEYALQSAHDIIKLLKWPIKEFIGSLAVGAALLKEGQLQKEIGTIPVNKRFLVGATLGTGRALLSGEEGSFASFTPLNFGQMIVGALHNDLAHTNVRRENYNRHVNTDIKELDMCHLGLGYPSVLNHVIARIALHGEIIVHENYGSTELNHDQWRRVHARKIKHEPYSPVLQELKSAS